MSNINEQLLWELLSKPVGDFRPAAAPSAHSTQVERSGDTLKVTVPENVPEGAASDFLRKEGLNPDDWEVKKFNRSEWAGDKSSTRFEFIRRQATAARASLTDAELATIMSGVKPAERAGRGPYTALLALGDMQFGKEADDAAVVARLVAIIKEARHRIEAAEDYYGEIVVAWLGDHVEGFESQGGNNAWRTPMPLSEQIRLTRRTMMFAMTELAETGLSLSMLAVPGNHGEAKRFGKGVTTYDDNHDTEALLAVMDAAQLSEAYKGVEFFVPQTDELSVSLDLSGTTVVFTHGHMARGANKLMDWVKGQAFNRSSVYANADLVVAGHFHHFFLETSTDRTVVIAPALETQSTWYRHHSGTGGNPGALLMDVGAGRLGRIDVLRGDG